MNYLDRGIGQNIIHIDCNSFHKYIKKLPKYGEF
jgi:hypothetical protein